MIDSSPPELVVSRWFNTSQPLSLGMLKGRVIVVYAFQMLCPACVAHGTPQAERLHRLFADKGLSVLGLHTVFEHHEAMTPVSLEAFIHEYRLTFPIGVDAAGEGTPIPITMGRYGMRGTPTTIVIDRTGRLRAHLFGQTDDLSLGALVGSLLAEKCSEALAISDSQGGADNSHGCEANVTSPVTHHRLADAPPADVRLGKSGLSEKGALR